MFREHLIVIWSVSQRLPYDFDYVQLHNLKRLCEEERGEFEELREAGGWEVIF